MANFEGSNLDHYRIYSTCRKMGFSRRISSLPTFGCEWWQLLLHSSVHSCYLFNHLPVHLLWDRAPRRLRPKFGHHTFSGFPGSRPWAHGLVELLSAYLEIVKLILESDLNRIFLSVSTQLELDHFPSSLSRPLLGQQACQNEQNDEEARQVSHQEPQASA